MDASLKTARRPAWCPLTLPEPGIRPPLSGSAASLMGNQAMGLLSQSDAMLLTLGGALVNSGVSVLAQSAGAATGAASASPGGASEQGGPARKSCLEEDGPPCGQSDKPGPGASSDFFAPRTPAPVDDIDLQTLGPTQKAWIGHALGPSSVLEATGSGLFQSTTDSRQGWTGQVGGGLQARFVLTPNTELGVGGTYGRTFTLGSQTLQGPPNFGSVYGSLHLSQTKPKQSQREGVGGFGFFAQGGVALGAGPSGESGWSFSGTGAYSNQWPLRNLGLDINAGLSASRYGQINGVSVGNVVTPFASMGVSLPANLGVEAFGCLPVPTGGNLTDPSTTGVPLALRLGFGIGYQFAMGDYALGIEGGLLSEWGNVGLPDTSSRFVNYSPWLNIAFGARNRNVSFGEPFR